MSTQTQQHPIYLRLASVLVALVAIFFIVYIGRDILMPMAFAGIFAILINPAVEWLTAKGLNRILAIALVLIVAMAAVGGVMWFVASQIGKFMTTLPEFREKLASTWNEVLFWLKEHFNLSPEQVNGWLKQAKSEGSSHVGQALGALGSLFAVVFLIPIYTFFMVYYRPLLLDFIAKLFPREQHGTVVEVLNESKVLIQSYLTGLMIEMVIVAALDAGALLIIGVRYALLLGIVGALLNLIPYIGGLVAITLPTLVALATQSPACALWVIAAYAVIQFVDNNVIVPKIVASKVRINALISILVVLIGGALWGVPGMFLSLPVTAILKVIFDRVEPLKPWGILLGDNMPPIGKRIFYFRRARSPKAVAKAE